MPIINNRCKCVSSIGLYIFALVEGLFGSVLFIYWFHNIRTYELNGGEYLPELQIDYKKFSTSIQTGCFGAIGCFGLAMIVAYYKKMYLSILYLVAVFSFGAILVQTADEIK